MKITVINTGLFKLDGGAMFGVVPKSIWSRTNPSDEQNMCTWAMRCLLIEQGDQKILIDTGIGNKQSDKFFSYFSLHRNDSLISSLEKAGVKRAEITDVFLTHLHFDHVGGAVLKDNELTFPNAIYWSNEKQWNWAKNPNAREKASFLVENMLPIEESGQLKFINSPEECPFENIELHFVSGHTESQMLPIIHYQGKKIAFVADLIPSIGHLPIPYVMAYDTRPLLTLEEKDVFLEKAVNENYILFFEHDSVNECCTLQKTERGIRAKEIFDLESIQ